MLWLTLTEYSMERISGIRETNTLQYSCCAICYNFYYGKLHSLFFNSDMRVALLCVCLALVDIFIFSKLR